VGGASFAASKLEVAIAATIKALAGLLGALAEPKGQFPPVCRVPEQGSGRGGCGNASGEKGAVWQSDLPGRGTGNSHSGEEDFVRRSGLPELIPELAQSAAGPGGSAGSIEKTLCRSCGKVLQSASGRRGPKIKSSQAAPSAKLWCSSPWR
jgi:hypothetical protein